jgi:crotonobetainyl-CoA:carnitine CoA-transferase CaiB-like acyl-CoA transferase
MSGALEGIKVAAFAHFAVGPTAAQTLGDMGAEVIKVEAPWRDLNRYAIREDDKLDGISPYFLALNRNQRDIVLDLKHPGGKEVALRIFEWADIVIENHRPGVMDKLGLGYKHAREVNEDIIYCSCSAYGQEGPWRDRPGQDLLIQASSGLASLSGAGDGPPVPVGAYIVDAYTAMLMVGGILAALHYRSKTGKGQWIQIDMLSAVLHMLSQEATYIMNVDPEPRRSKAGIAHVQQSAPYGVYETKDGSLAISLAEPDVVEAIAKDLDVFEEVQLYLNKEGLRIHRDLVASAFARKLRSLTTEEALQRLTSAGAWCEPVRRLPEVLQMPVVAQSGMVVSITADYGGTYRTIGNPLKFSESPTSIRRPAPAWGEHTCEILEELGYSATEIEKLISGKAAYASRYPSREAEREGQ